MQYLSIPANYLQKIGFLIYGNHILFRLFRLEISLGQYRNILLYISLLFMALGMVTMFGKNERIVSRFLVVLFLLIFILTIYSLYRLLPMDH
jgi:hypothetical protein